jgi:hypothetical protein
VRRSTGRLYVCWLAPREREAPSRVRASASLRSSPPPRPGARNGRPAALIGGEASDPLKTLPTRPEQARRGAGLGRSHLAECERGNAAASPRGTRGYPGRTSTLRGATLFRMLRPGRRSSRRSRFTRSSDFSLSKVAGQAPAAPATGWSAPIAESAPRLAKRASPRRRRPACSPSSDSGSSQRRRRCPHLARLGATGLSTVVLKPFLSFAVR